MQHRRSTRTTSEPGRRWAEALALWAIPEHIRAQAPADPWAHEPRQFAVDDDVDALATPSGRAAAAMLEPGGSLLDVGCGGGRASIPLTALSAHGGGPLVTALTGVDANPAMLEQFQRSASARGVDARTVHGVWPDAAATAPIADVVVAHHVAYNVATIDAFVAALSEHARRGVIVELPQQHPLSSLSPLWRRFWDLDRPTEPTASLFVDVVRAGGWEPFTVDLDRPVEPIDPDDGERVAAVRRHLCLSSDRDADVAAALTETPIPGRPTQVATVWWRTR